MAEIEVTLDLKIVGGVVVDGTRRPRFRADIGVRDGRIVAVGTITEPARETIDAEGRIVAPGFIDCHTHYDAQVFWDPKLTPSCYHGVTTVVGGFCGFSIAPITPDAATYIRRMLARVEGMPLATLETAVPWASWRSFGDFLNLIEGRAGLNVGFFCGHSPIRRIAMGERAVGRRSTAAEVEAMKKLLRASLAEGALGFSSTISPGHNDGDGRPVPSRWADYSELLELAGVVREFPGAGLELLPDLEFDPEVVELMVNFSIAGDRPVNWNVLVVAGEDRASASRRIDRMLQVSDLARQKGGEVLALVMPGSPEQFLTLENGVSFDAMPGLWRSIFRVPVDERIEQFKDPAVRAQLLHDAESISPESPMRNKNRFADYTVVTVVADHQKSYEGRKVGDIAQKLGCGALEAMLDIAVADRLRTTFSPPKGGESHEIYELRGEVWRDDRTLIGASDAGAHLDMIDSFAFSTHLLQHSVREHRVVTLEEAIHQITDRIARYFGFIHRGRIEAGYWADLVILDEETVGRAPTYMRYDVPGESGRIYADAVGIPHVFVNGVQIVRDGEHTGALPGSVLRSGRDTRTVAMSELQEKRVAAE